MSIEVKQRINVLEKDGEYAPDDCTMAVNSHGESDEWVTLVFENVQIAVLGEELIQAAMNAMNVS